ncbi:hypothetical protein ACGFSB_21630 [Streptomyces sp. NPDC048441]|uniref:hypothetical protein n=1 Tax=Streptomyces sp. NPDC048441 TaxID=3365552 RepID=UPI003717C6BD
MTQFTHQVWSTPSPGTSLLTLDSSPRPWTWPAIGRPLLGDIPPQAGAGCVGNLGDQVWPPP